MKGIVFNIERYAIEDGPGIRTVVFLKGCPLQCEWCANPESQNIRPQVMYFANKCVLCGRCVERCPQKALSADNEFGILTDFAKCDLCGECIDFCYYGARDFTGKEMTVQEVTAEVLRDLDFYKASGGGVTFSGGEPLFQPEFLKELIMDCKSKGVHTTVETCLFAKKETVVSALSNVDLVYADIKHLDTIQHKKRIGAGNEQILQNILLLDSLNKKMIIRVPFIPDFNDQLETQKEIYLWASHLKNLLWIEILPYHKLGFLKYKGLGRQYLWNGVNAVKRKDLLYLKEAGRECNVLVKIGAV